MPRTITTILFACMLASPAPAVALGSRELAVVINVADPTSVEIGEYYARRRGVPAANVVRVTLPTGRDEIAREEFEVAKREMDARLPASVQALATTRAPLCGPIRVS